MALDQVDMRSPSSGRRQFPHRLAISLGTLVPFLISLTIAIQNFRYPAAVYQNAGGDHYSHVSVTLAFLAHGLDVYRKPMDEILDRAPTDSAMAVQNHLDPDSLFLDPFDPGAPPLEVVGYKKVRPYPPGLYVLLFPVAMLYHFRIVGFRWACRIVVLGLLLVCACISNLLIEQAFEAKDRWSIGTRLTAALVVVAWSYCWALFGFYDVTALLLILVSLRALGRQRWIDSIFYFWLAAFVHSRSLYAFPIFLFALAGILREGRPPLRSLAGNPKIWISLAAALACITTSLITLPYVTKWAPNNLYFHLDGMLFHLGFAMVLGSLLGAICGIAMIATRQIGALLLLLFPWAFMLQTPEVRIWHSIFWLPLVIYCSLDVSTGGRKFVWLSTMAMVAYLTCLVYGIELWLF
jgi:hypothetical protein